MLDEILVFGIGSMLFTLLVALWMTRPKLEIVPEEERVVIYRFGKFDRVAGPGRVWVRRRIDQVERTLHVREQPHYLKFNGLYAYDIPVGYTLSLWYKLDPQAAANGDQHMLRKLAQFDSRECDENIRVRIHDLFIKHIADAMSKHQLPSKPTVLDKLIPFCPGQQQCNEILAKIRRELPEVLRSFGAVINPDQPIAIKDFHLGNSIIQLLDRDRVLDGFMQKIPNGDPDLLTQAALAIEGYPINAINKMVFEQNHRPADSHRIEGMVADQIADQVADQVAAKRAMSTNRRPQPQAGHRNIPLERREQMLVPG